MENEWNIANKNKVNCYLLRVLNILMNYVPYFYFHT